MANTPLQPTKPRYILCALNHPARGSAAERQVVSRATKFAVDCGEPYSGGGMPTAQLPIHSDPEIMGGTPVFIGTRVPVQTLLDYLEGGDPLSEFLEDFPSVSREQVVAVLELAKEMLLARATAA
jgi:uncharacterized protein (DUF433 family)